MESVKGAEKKESHAMMSPLSFAFARGTALSPPSLSRAATMPFLLNSSAPRAATGLLACLFVVGCGSDKDPADDASAADAATSATPTAVASSSAGARSTNASGLDSWIEYAPVVSSPAATASHHFVAAPPAPPTDPDVAIERFEKECSADESSQSCRALRREVEGGFLAAILAVRASDEPVDPEWYRVAATADMPQLACLGVNELGYVQGRTAEDDALIVSALDHPAPSVRAAAFSLRQKVPVLGDLMRRSAASRDGGSGTCLDSTTDFVPGVKWAGGYPGARFRAFASNDSRRWFTSEDPVEKVLAWFAKSGKTARTKEQLGADVTARFTEEMTRLSSSSDPADQDRLMKLVMGGMTGVPETDWDSSSSMEGTGEIKYVTLTPDQAIAVFRDDVLKATSIVAPRPRAKIEFPPDIEKAKREVMARSILGY